MNVKGGRVPVKEDAKGTPPSRYIVPICGLGNTGIHVQAFLCEWD